MKKLIFMVLAIVLVAGPTTTIKAQNSSKATTNAGATIVKAITIVSDAQLNFGTMSAPTADVNVTLSTLHVMGSDKPTNINFLPDPFTNAHYNVTGASGYAYTISLPTNGTITIKNPANNSMQIDDFEARPASKGANGKLGMLDASGIDDFIVGATLKIQSGQATGTYTGSFEVTVTYN